MNTATGSAPGSWQSPHGRPLPVPGGRTLVMGILNVTPDSFSDGGQLRSIQAVVDRAGELLAQGADLLDLGGESTRPGASAVSETEELDRVLPALAAVRQSWPQVPVSIDSTKAPVAAEAIRAGADIINDVRGVTHGLPAGVRHAWAEAIRRNDPWPELPRTAMAETAALCRCPVILMHNRPEADYRDFWPDVLADLRLSVSLARKAGVPDYQLWLDPGFGFAKDVAQNLEILKNLHRIVALGHPVLLGTSRKSTIGRVLGSPTGERVDGTGATLVWGIQQGCSMVRVHDVAPMMRYVRMADAIKAGINHQA